MLSRNRVLLPMTIGLLGGCGPLSASELANNVGSPPKFTDPTALGTPAPPGLLQPGKSGLVIVLGKCSTSCPYPAMPDDRLKGFGQAAVLDVDPHYMPSRELAESYQGEVKPLTNALVAQMGVAFKPRMYVYGADGKLEYVQPDPKPWPDAVSDYLAFRKKAKRP